MRCADAIFTDSKVKTKLPTKKEGRYKKDRQDKYYLRHTDYQFIPLTELQKTKVNSAIGEKHDPSKYLSPRQLQMLANLTKKQPMISEEFKSTWWKIAS